MTGRNKKELEGVSLLGNQTNVYRAVYVYRKAFLCGVGERANDYRSFPDTYRGVSAGQKGCRSGNKGRCERCSCNSFVAAPVSGCDNIHPRSHQIWFYLIGLPGKTTA